MPGQFGKDGAGDPDNVASYVATLSGDLALMARRHGLDTLGYLLDMARLEAENLTRATTERSRTR
jgi:hypothetical protein